MPGLADVELCALPPELVTAEQLASLVHDTAAIVLKLAQLVCPVAWVIVPDRLARRLAARLVGDEPGELDAPRPTTWAERGVVAYAVLAAIDGNRAVAAAGGITVEVLGRGRRPGPEDCAPVAVPVQVRWPGHRHTAFVVVPRAWRARSSPRPVAELLATWGYRLDRAKITAGIITGRGRLARSWLATVKPGDVVAMTPASGRGASSCCNAWLALGRGAVPVELRRSRGQVIVRGEYARDMATSEAKTSEAKTSEAKTSEAKTSEAKINEAKINEAKEMAADDVAVEVSCRVGSVAMSARQVLELTPGQIVPLGRPLDGPVDLLCGDRVIASGQLVAIDGEIGVRVSALES